jgi:hypothetical protein
MSDAVKLLRKSACLAIALWVASIGFVALSDDFGTDDGFDFTAEIAVTIVAALMLAHLGRVVDRRHAAYPAVLLVQADPRSPPRV